MSPVRILLLGFYFPPDISPGAFRAEALLHALDARLPEGSEVHMVSTAPHRFTQGQVQVAKEECLPSGKSRITRLEITQPGKGMAGQAMGFLGYGRQVAKLTRGEHYDLVVATSSRLMTAVLARWLANRHGAKLYQDIRDNFVDNLPHVLPGGIGKALAPFFGLLERWALCEAQRVNLVSRGFAPYFTSRYPLQHFSWHTNGIDLSFVHAVEQGIFLPGPERRSDAPLKVLYAGNLGAGQGLEHILPALAKRLEGRAEFRIIGAGGGADALQQALDTQRVSNVTLQPPIPRDALIQAYRDTDVLFLHLNTLPSLDTVLPSKLFEYAATGRPIWAGVAGFAGGFIEEEIDNAAVFLPADVESAVAALGRLALSSRPRSRFVARWRRDRIMEEMADEVLAVVKNEA
ncbi:glycosyltransferase family 4 protein [Franzmannia qiaohouensis]|uniref:Glycosyltransferase family 4 protein n=1 Tax=Franzmannia qiaohouensis TaxID=1329370 RepID=A0ABU1HJM6_9GAMM|nr:glycosyltransferase family 4 protein [Halomonas qiaohouensis]MDR5907496.1 glycosyltransferase family 4 protein [Halomonas qiaohouensis]